MNLPTIDARTLSEDVREGLACIDCGSPDQATMRPVGRVYAPGDASGWQVFTCCVTERETSDSGCINEGECTRHPGIGCLCQTTGKILVDLRTERKSEALTVYVSEYERATVWRVIYGHAPLGAEDAAYLATIEDVTVGAALQWAVNLPSTPHERLHVYVETV